MKKLTKVLAILSTVCVAGGSAVLAGCSSKVAEDKAPFTVMEFAYKAAASDNVKLTLNKTTKRVSVDDNGAEKTKLEANEENKADLRLFKDKNSAFADVIRETDGNVEKSYIRNNAVYSVKNVGGADVLSNVNSVPKSQADNLLLERGKSVLISAAQEAVSLIMDTYALMNDRADIAAELENYKIGDCHFEVRAKSKVLTVELQKEVIFNTDYKYVYTDAYINARGGFNNFTTEINNVTYVTRAYSEVVSYNLEIQTGKLRAKSFDADIKKLADCEAIRYLSPADGNAAVDGFKNGTQAELAISGGGAITYTIGNTETTFNAMSFGGMFLELKYDGNYIIYNLQQDADYEVQEDKVIIKAEALGNLHTYLSNRYEEFDSGKIVLLTLNASLSYERTVIAKGSSLTYKCESDAVLDFKN